MTPPDRDALVLRAALWKCQGITMDTTQTKPCSNCVVAIRTAVAALEAAGVALMPVASTREMRDAAIALSDHDRKFPGAIYAAMISASPYRSKP